MAQYTAALWYQGYTEINQNAEVTFTLSWDTVTGWDPNMWAIIPYVYPLTIRTPGIEGDVIGGSVEITRSWIERFGTHEPGYPLVNFNYTVKNLTNQVLRFNMYNILIPPAQ